jgi:hypothetical protein
MAISRIVITAVVLTLAILSGGVRGLAKQSYALDERPLSLPRLRPNQPCPRSTGRRNVVPSQPQIFGAGGFWFGDGPVFLGLFWKDESESQAVFPLSRVPKLRNVYSAKTGWVIDPSYAGPILIRGHALVADEAPLMFRALDWKPDTILRLTTPNVSPATLGSFWPSTMYVSEPGCYGVQIDTLQRTDAVVFEAT